MSHTHTHNKRLVYDQLASFLFMFIDIHMFYCLLFF